uniref:Uncharacterized protein n=1 Tax=Globodera pallida TaxID=36090 RepID=A0A183BSS5_GLOPA
MAVSGAECGCFGSKPAPHTTGSGQQRQQQTPTSSRPYPLPVPTSGSLKGPALHPNTHPLPIPPLPPQAKLDNKLPMPVNKLRPPPKAKRKID